MNLELLLRAIADVSAQTLLVFLLAGAGFGLLIGLWLLIAPTHFFAATAGWNRWISMRPALKPLETPVYLERYFYRYHRLFGVALLLAAGYIFGYFVFSYDPAAITRQLGLGIEGRWVLDATVFILRLASPLIAAVGLLMCLRPSLLKNPEDRSNRWVSTRQWLRPLEVSRPVTEPLAQRHPRLAGAAIVALCCYTFLSLLLMAFHWFGGPGVLW